MNNYVFADDGVMQKWLSMTYALVSTGGTITILGAVTFGIPVIRIIPDNTFYYDPFSSSNYPLNPVNTSSEIRQQLQLIEKIQKNEKELFKKIAENTLKDYFTEPDKENLKVFLC